MLSKRVKVVQKDYFKIAGNVIAGLVIALFFVAVPLYFRNGYQKIATHKYNLMIWGSIFIIFATILYFVILILLRGISTKDISKYKSVMIIDISVLSYALVSILSYYFSIYKTYGVKEKGWFVEGALYGTEGWYMGLVTVLMMVTMYFIISRTLTYSDFIWVPIGVVSIVVFIWAILNRFEIYPVQMMFQTEKFLSTIGNINWLAGYSSIVMPIVIGMFWKTKSEKMERILLFPLIVTLSSVLMNGSDSIVLAFMVMMLVLLLFSYKDIKLLLKFCEIFLLFSLNGVLIYYTDTFYEITRNDYSEIGKIFDGGAWSLIWFMLGLMSYLYIYLCVNDRARYPKWCEENLGKVVAYAALCIGLICLFLLIINTLLGNTLPGIRKIGLFYFNYEWGTKRGAIFEEAYWTFRENFWWQKLIGTGPDTFYFQLVNTPKAMRINDYVFGESRLTNAHCEMLTVLINQGVLGVASMLSILIIAYNKFKRQIKDEPGVIIYVLVIVMYATNNLISFQTVLNTPLLFVILGIGTSQLKGIACKNKPLSSCKVDKP